MCQITVNLGYPNTEMFLHLASSSGSLSDWTRQQPHTDVAGLFGLWGAMCQHPELVVVNCCGWCQHTHTCSAVVSNLKWCGDHSVGRPSAEGWLLQQIDSWANYNTATSHYSLISPGLLSLKLEAGSSTAFREQHLKGTIFPGVTTFTSTVPSSALSLAQQFLTK